MVDSLKEQAFNSMQWTAGSSTFVSVVQLIQVPVLAFFLSPEEIGTMTMLMLVIWFTQAISDGGMSPAIIHHKTVEQSLLNVLYLLNLIGAVGLYVLLIVLSTPISFLFGQNELIDYIPVSMLVVIFGGFATQFRVILIKEMRFDVIARQDITTATVYFIIAVLLAKLGYGVWSMVIGYLIGTATGTLILIYYGIRYWLPSLSFTTAGLSKFIHFGKYQLGERILIFFNSRLDQLMIGALIGPHALGIYSIAYNFVFNPTIRVNQIISSVMFPVFARLQESTETLRNGYLKLIRVVILFNTPIMLGMILTAPLFIPLLFDTQWYDSIYILQVLGLTSLIRSTGGPTGSLQLAKGRSDLGFKWNLIRMVVIAPCIYAGAVLGGLQGVAWSLLALSIFLLVPFWFLMIRPLIQLPAMDYFSVLFRAVLPGLFMAGIVWMIAQFSIYPEPVLKLSIMILGGMTFFYIFTWYLDHPVYLEISEMIKTRYFTK